jgi:hypothetical protein
MHFVATEGVACPWGGWDPGTVQFCEERLCAWVVEPSNAWSSVFYLLLGLYMLSQALRPVAPRSIAVAAAQIMIGVGSFFFHATGTFVGEFVDQFGLFMLSALILACSAAQARSLTARQTVFIYAAIVVASALLLWRVRPIGIPLFATQLAVGLGWQVQLFRQSRGPIRAAHRPFFVGVGLFLFSFSIWVTDITRLLCDPQNHIVTGHAIWHVLNAVCIERLGAFYRRRFALSQAG